MGVGHSLTKDLTLNGTEYVVYLHNPPKSHLATAILVSSELNPSTPHFVPLPSGLFLQLRFGTAPFALASLHLPHDQREDAFDVWTSTIEHVTQALGNVPAGHPVMIGGDFNQPLNTAQDTFSPMAQLRLLIARFRLRITEDVGPTWHARGLEAPLDFLLFRNEGMLGSATKREDLRLALPSDHDLVLTCFQAAPRARNRNRMRRDRCGRWCLQTEQWDSALAQLPEDPSEADLSAAFLTCSFRPKFPRYRDSEQVRDLIRRRKISVNTDERTALAQEVACRRAEDKTSFKQDILDRARSGDFAAISHLRRSAAQTKVAGSYIQARGGQDAATKELRDFYDSKYDTKGSGPSPALISALCDKHKIASPVPFSLEEVRTALQGVKAGTAAGSDGVTYEALVTFAASDKAFKLVNLLNSYFTGARPIPPHWKRGSICLLPKVSQPGGPADLRPIALTPCLCKIYSKLLLNRLEGSWPDFQAGQFACRKGSQAIDGAAAASLLLQIGNARLSDRPVVAKLDLKAAFDSLSHDSILKYLLQVCPNHATWALWQLCQDCEVCLRLGSDSWQTPTKRGVLQGTAYSAILFSRVVDSFLGPLIRSWEQRWPSWELPHLLLYADDILVAARGPEDLQFKVQQVADVLSALGLQVNRAKCSVLDTPDGSGPGVWLRGSCIPLKTERRLLYLGVPLSYDFRPMTCFARSLGRCANTYFAMRGIFNARRLPAARKVKLFELYVTSRWLWSCGLCYPTRQSLKSLDAHQNTLLVGLLGFRADFFGEFLHNTVSKRRAARATLTALRMDPWSKRWATQTWRYWGHVIRNQMDTPLRYLVWRYSTFSLMSGDTWPGWVVNTPLRKFQLCYGAIRDASHPAIWETAAHDRAMWQQLYPLWRNHWERDRPNTDLLGRQLVIINNEDAALRPFRFFPDEDYIHAVCYVHSLSKLPAGALLWAHSDEVGVSVTVVPPARDNTQVLLLQERHHPTQTSDNARALHLWLLVGYLHDTSPQAQGLPIAMPMTCMHPCVLTGDIGLNLRLRYNTFDRQDQQHDLLRRAFVYGPKDAVKHFPHLANPCVGPFPPGYNRLVRDGSFETCNYTARSVV